MPDLNSILAQLRAEQASRLGKLRSEQARIAAELARAERPDPDQLYEFSFRGVLTAQQARDLIAAFGVELLSGEPADE